jgi:hypothetical protein
MKEYLTSDGDPLVIEYRAPAGTDSLVYDVYDTSLGEYLIADQAEKKTAVTTPVAYQPFHITLPYDVVKYNRKIQINLQVIDQASFTEDVLYASLVRPYATVTDLQLALGITGQADSLKALERRARLVIDSKLSDQFGFTYESIQAYGQGSDVLDLRKRAESFDKVIKDDQVIFDSTEDPAINLFYRPVAIAESKTRLKVIEEGANLFEWAEPTVLANERGFEKNSLYTVRGEYGWRFVPLAIKEATIMLVEDMRCGDWSYRNTGLKSVKNDAFDLEYNPNIYSGTGNLAVDSLIAPYKNFNLLVI